MESLRKYARRKVILTLALISLVSWMAMPGPSLIRSKASASNVKTAPVLLAAKQAATATCPTSNWSAEGNVNDSSGINNGTLKNGATFAPGYVGQAFSLDGNSAYVEVPINTPELNSPASFTWEAWIKPTSLASNPVVFSKEADVFNRAGLQILPNGSLCTYMNSSTCNAISAAGAVSTGVFTKVTLVYDGSTHNLVTYVNDLQVSSVAAASPYNNSAPFNIGWSLFGSGNTHFPGLIDEVKFSGCAVTPTPTPTPSCLTSIIVPATVNIWLAGMPNGSTDGLDSAPAQSPVQVTGIPVTPGDQLRLLAFGTTGFIPGTDLFNQDSKYPGPDGEGATGNSGIFAVAGSGVLVNGNSLNGMELIRAPRGALLGVFLDNNRPSLTDSPGGYFGYSDFLTLASRDYSTLSPQLKQVFFIGDGKTSSGVQQSIVVPAGATRLFLATHDYGNMINKAGALTVKVATCGQTPTPTTTACSTSTTAGLTAYWPEDGNANDVIGANNPSATNAINFVTGKAGQGVTFGTGGYIEVPDSATLDTPAITLAAWAQPNGPGPNSSNSAGSEIIAKDTSRMFTNLGGPQVSIGLFWRSDTNRFQLAVGKLPTVETYFSSAHVFPPGQSYHVVGSYDGTMANLYVNGVLEASQYIGGPIDYDHTVPWTIGSTWAGFRNAGFPRTWNGVIDCVRIYNRALTGEDVAGLYSDCGCTANPTATPTPTPTPSTCPATTITVPGTANPSLAGMPNGSTALSGDSAPNESPVLMSGLQVNGGATFNFSASGGVTFDALYTQAGPDGAALIYHGADNGVAPINAPIDALIGVFLDDNQPTTTPPPTGLDFSTAASRDYLTLSPGLKQPFFIGDGKTSGGATQTVVAPVGATRLFLATMDGYGWYNNLGAFTVTVNGQCPAASTPTPTLTGGLPPDGGIMGPGNGFTPVSPGHFQTTLTGTGNPSCTIQVTVTDPARPANNSTQTTTVGTSGTWSLSLDLYDCDPEIDIVQICGGVASDPVRRHLYVDGTPPVFTSGGGPGDGTDFITGGGGTATIILDGSAGDPGNVIHLPPGDGVTYEWHLIGSGGSDTLLGGGGGSYWSFTGGGILNINLAPGDYDIEVIVTDKAGNKLIRHCHRRVRKPVTVTSGLPADGGIYGPGDGITVGKVTRTLTGTGDHSCTISITVSDPTHPQLVDNNKSYTVATDAAGNWSLNLTLDDCDPVVEIAEVCGGDSGGTIRRHVYVDGTPPTVGLADDNIYVGTGGTGGIILDAAAGDAGSLVPNDGLSYAWYIIGNGGTGTPTLLCSGCPGTYTINEPAGDYYFQVVVTDRAGNKTIKLCHRGVLRRPTSITCPDAQVPYGGLITFTNALKDNLSGAELAGKPLAFKLAGQPVPNPYEALLAPGTYDLTVSFAGDDIYEGCTGNGYLTILSTPGKITGGGSIDQNVRNFGFVVQTKTQAGVISYTGSLTYQDKAKGYNLQSTAITNIAIAPDRVHGVFTGTATMNGVTGYTFTVYVEDKAEPGAGVDTFRIQISGPGGFSYDSATLATNGGILDQGGNIQIHKQP